jgi:citrate lyase subunit alpha/citrate CoA-transferase
MKKYDKLVENAAGRMVPTKINGETHIPYKGVGKHIPVGRRYGPPLASCANFPDDGNKLVSDIKEAAAAPAPAMPEMGGMPGMM